MTVAEAMRAAENRVPVKVCGASAKKLYGSPKYRRISRVAKGWDKYGKPFWVVTVVGEVNGRQDSVLDCDPKDLELTDDVPETLRRLVYQPEQKTNERPSA